MQLPTWFLVEQGAFLLIVLAVGALILWRMKKQRQAYFMGIEWLMSRMPDDYPDNGRRIGRRLYGPRAKRRRGPTPGPEWEEGLESDPTLPEKHPVIRLTDEEILHLQEAAEGGSLSTEEAEYARRELDREFLKQRRRT